MVGEEVSAGADRGLNYASNVPLLEERRSVGDALFSSGGLGDLLRGTAFPLPLSALDSRY